MTPRSRLFACSALAVAFGFLCAPTATPADLSKDTAKAATAADVAALQKKMDELTSAEKVASSGVRTARGLCLTLISYGDDATKAQAAKVLAALKGGKDMKTPAALAKDLTAPKAGKAGSIEGLYDLDDVMYTFRNSKVGTGGLNIEKDLRDALKEKKIDAKDALVLGARTAALAEYTVKMPSEKATTNASMKTKWERWSKDMVAAGTELTEAATKNDAKAMLTAVKKIDKSCSDCHNDFKE